MSYASPFPPFFPTYPPLKALMTTPEVNAAAAAVPCGARRNGKETER
jgi:hypothetical protein